MNPSSSHPRRIPRVELLESRRVLASISGMVALDTDADLQLGTGDEAVPHAIVWIDRDGDRALDPAIDLVTLTDAQGRYAFDELEPGEYEVRYAAGPGLAQTSPFQWVGWRKNTTLEEMNLVAIDHIHGSLTDISPPAFPNRAGLIKTIGGEYYGAGHLLDTIVRFDPETGTEFAFPKTDKQFVAGLGYDPIMDELLMLASDTETDVRKLYRINRTTAEITPIADFAPNIAVAQATSGLTFNWITRELLSFDNLTDTFFSYDMQGNARQLGSFSSPFSFYNLAFDGSRYLTYRPEQGQIKVYELDPIAATATEIATFDGDTTGNAGELLAANEPHQISLTSSGESAQADFLAAKLRLQDVQVTIGQDSMRLVDLPTRLDVTYPLPEAVTNFKYCLSAAAFQIAVNDSESMHAVQLELSPEDDRLLLSEALTSTKIHGGQGTDRIRPVQSMEWDLRQPTGLESFEAVDLLHESAVHLWLDPPAIERLSSNNSLKIEMGPEDTLELEPSSWTANPPQLLEGKRMHQLAGASALLNLLNDSTWHNPLDPFDVNRDGRLAPLDALLVINWLNQTGGGLLDEGNEALVSAEYIDVNADNWLTPLDALLLVNHLNRPNS